MTLTLTLVAEHVVKDWREESPEELLHYLLQPVGVAALQRPLDGTVEAGDRLLVGRRRDLVEPSQHHGRAVGGFNRQLVQAVCGSNERRKQRGETTECRVELKSNISCHTHNIHHFHHNFKSHEKYFKEQEASGLKSLLSCRILSSQK